MAELFNRSLWLETADPPSFPTLEEPLAVDVAILGGGITGLTTAHFLKEAGKSVAVIEMNRIASATTGLSTAKLTVGHNLIYEDLLSKHGEQTARVYADSNQAAIERMERIVSELQIDCDWERASNYVYTESADVIKALESEASAARRVGIEATLTTDADLPFPVLGALRVGGQAQFHPAKYVYGLARSVHNAGSHVFERTRALAVSDGTVKTDRATVRARHVIVATQLPFLDRGLFFAKAHPQKSYAVAVQVEGERAPRGMYISAEQPTRSIRSAPGPDGSRYLIVGGEGHRPGDDPDTERRYAALEDFLRQRFVEAPVAFRWSTHDYVPVDRLPYIGTLTRREDRILVATGYAKWGLTKATVAAEVLADTVLGRSNKWASTYDSKRLDVKASVVDFVKENALVGVHFIGDRLRREGGDRGADLHPGQGKVTRIGGRHYALYRDEGGVLHSLSARCTHLGCIVGWSSADRTWECPCHGSRFAAEGALLQGPATRDLPRENV